MTRINTLIFTLLLPLVVSHDDNSGDPGTLNNEPSCDGQTIYVHYPHGCFK